MTVLTFPSNPTVGQQYAAPNGIQYVFDGVKWIVETTSSSSAAVTNSTQDRVAPMFVDGDHQGITFSYNAATNVMSADVTAVNGDRLVNGSNELILDTNGTLIYPNTAVQRDTATVSCPGNASTVVYTGSAPNQQTIKLLIQVEGSAPGDPYDTQACEMIIAKSFRANALAASVYGVVHTSVAPLATFTANWNALTNRVEVLCTTTAIAVSVRIFATEITTSD